MILALLLLGQQVAGPTPAAAASMSEAPTASYLATAIAQQVDAAPKRATMLPKLLYLPATAHLYPAASLHPGEQGEAVVRCTLRRTGNPERAPSC